MGKPWTLGINVCYLGFGVSRMTESECSRLNAVLNKHCQGPYDEEEIELGLGLFLLGRKQKIQQRSPASWIKLESSRKDPSFLYANIYMSYGDSEQRLSDYLRNLWEASEKGLLACATRLQKRKVGFDCKRLRHDLSLVEVEFLGAPLQDETRRTIQEPGWMPVNPRSERPDRLIVIQYRIGGHGNGSDHDKRIHVENVLDEALESAGLGYCDGGDIGSGMMNVFCFVKANPKGAKLILEILRRNGLHEDAVVAETVDGDANVIWPMGFKGEFKLI